VRNTIIAGNTGAAATPDVSGTITSQGNNLIGNIGTSVGWLMSDLQNVDPLLSPLGFHGGFGMTHYPMDASMVINGGQSCVVDLSCAAANPPVAIVQDQRGAARSTSPGVDIGAVEVVPNHPADLPNAFANVPYNFTLVPNSGAFTYSINSGTLGGLMISGSAPTIVSGTAPAIGVYEAIVRISNGGNQADVRYRIVVSTGPSIRGRVLTSTGDPVDRAYVTLQDSNSPASYTTVTGSFGFFFIDNIPLGTMGNLLVSSKKGLTFDPVPVTVNDAMDGVVIQANPPSASGRIEKSK
jgi:hypothetical protein